MKKIYLILIFFSLSTISPATWAYAETTTFAYPLRIFNNAGNGVFTSQFGPAFTAPEDEALTNISFSITGIPIGSVYDLCIYLQRTTAPLIPLATATPSEIYCTHATRMGSGSGWSGVLDISSTPIYIMSGIKVYCAAVGYIVSDGSNLRLNCSLGYHSLMNEEAVYQVVRFPYVDQLQEVSGGSYTITKAYYQASIPRQVGGFAFFQGYLENYIPQNTSTICLRWLSLEYGLQDTACAPTQYFLPNVNNDNPVIVYPVNWTLPAGDFLSASCLATRPADCALFTFIRIPNSNVGTPDAMVASSFVARRFFDLYCDTYAPGFTHPYFGTDKVTACKNLFP